MKSPGSQTNRLVRAKSARIELASGQMGGVEANGLWDGETKKLGQVATPPAVASLMARWVMSVDPSQVLDPAVGLGNLLHACERMCPGIKMVGVERDEATFQQARHSAPQGTKLVLADYLFSDSGQFSGIIANPPYVKSQRLEYSTSDWKFFDERFGITLDRLTNLYAIFLLKIWEDLAPGGRAAVLLPAEFMNANFGTEIKERLVEMRPAGLIVFAPELSLFSDALTTSAILFLERGTRAEQPLKAIKASSLAMAEGFVSELLDEQTNVSSETVHDLRNFDPRSKWLNTLLESSPSKCVQYLPCRIGDYFQCRRGIATGANDFFCLSQSLLCEHGLSMDHVEPCVTKAADADGLVFTPHKLRELARCGQRCYLLSPRKNGKELDAYLRLGQGRGIHERHLPSHRPVWYQPENRAVADIWVAVFSRAKVKFILNTSGAKNLTCFHGLYPRDETAHRPPLLVLYLNSAWGRIAFSQVNRFYGDGLNKLEPKDVEDMPCPGLPAMSREQAATLTERLKALEALPEGDCQRQLNTLVTEILGLPVLESSLVDSIYPGAQTTRSEKFATFGG